ncbi:hypothetical protein LY90DRAFT_701487 [Neocallimastix californiae]|uniref:Uncharacterized protein n=1 Tax=Neocallimastix californiae TaxID=1754190 RepID=A0A1Y2DID6_9FUNG|nr:hypothetical protein LY90DRAFT_701487 [Neocallimastix californiae]|eukprot:ORY58990.1 hypothetical protein LY90DRAFT_701487 [Neocallimastix californiae]
MNANRDSRVEQIIDFISAMFNNSLLNFREHIGNRPIVLEMEKIYRRNTPLQYTSFNFIIDYIMEHHGGFFFNLGIEQLINIELMNFQPLKLVINNGINERTNNGKINVPLTLNLGFPGETNIKLVKIRNVISSYDFNYGDILRKLEKKGNKGKINLNREKVTIEDLGNYHEVNDLTLKINSNSNDYSYLLLFTLNERIIAIGEIMRFIGEKQFFRKKESSYIISLIENEGLYRFMYYMNAMLININEFRERFRYGIEVRMCEERNIVFDENNYEFGRNTQIGVARRKIRYLKELIEIFVSNDGPIQENQELNEPNNDIPVLQDNINDPVLQDNINDPVPQENNLHLLDQNINNNAFENLNGPMQQIQEHDRIPDPVPQDNNLQELNLNNLHLLGQNINNNVFENLNGLMQLIQEHNRIHDPVPQDNNLQELNLNNLHLLGQNINNNAFENLNGPMQLIQEHNRIPDPEPQDNLNYLQDNNFFNYY